MADGTCIRCGGGLVDTGIFCPKCRAEEDRKPDDARPVNERGFRVFLASAPQRYGAIKVTESSMAFAGAHCWIFQQGEAGREVQGVHVDVVGARLLHAALATFIAEAERGELTEPAYRAPDEDA